MIAKLEELLVKFDALRDRLSEREKLKAEVDGLAKQVEANKSRAASSKASVSREGEKHFEVESLYTERLDFYTARHSSLLREFQQYGECRLDILSALLLDFFAAQKYFAYAYGRSLFRLHEQLREADERSDTPLPNPSWQSLMTYVTQTDDSRALQSTDARPSLIMKLASADYSDGPSPRSQGAFAVPRVSPTSRHPPPQQFSRPDTFASPDGEIPFNPSVLHDPRNQPYLPLSIMMDLSAKRQSAQSDPSAIHSLSQPAEPPQRKTLPPPQLQQPDPLHPTPFPDLHSHIGQEASPEGKAASLVWKTTRDAFEDGGPPKPPPPRSGPRPPPSPSSSAGFDLLSGFSASPPPSQPAPPPPPPAPPGGRGGPPGGAPGGPPPGGPPPGGPPPPPQSRQPPPPASRAPGGYGGPPPPLAVSPPPPSPPPPRTAVSPPPPGGAPPPPASRQSPLVSPRGPGGPGGPFEGGGGFPSQPPPPAGRPPPGPGPGQAMSPRGSGVNGGLGFAPPPPASRGALPPPGQPPKPGPPPPKPAASKEWTPFDEDD